MNIGNIDTTKLWLPFFVIYVIATAWKVLPVAWRVREIGNGIFSIIFCSVLATLFAAGGVKAAIEGITEGEIISQALALGLIMVSTVGWKSLIETYIGLLEDDFRKKQQTSAEQKTDGSLDGE